MLRNVLLLTAALLPAAALAPATTDAPTFNADGSMNQPLHYREWVFLSAGLGMSYAAQTAEPAHQMFDNVFVNPSAYKVFVQTGTWPDGTTFALESREAVSAASINKAGRTQAEVMGLEVHVKDAGHGGWGFYSFDDGPRAKRIEQKASCYSCHEQHAAVDTTFGQFYPTLLPIAKEHHTLSAAYLKELGGTSAH